MSYVVRLEAFEGPMDLLLYLIQREEMDIYDIPIARITEQYLDHVRMMERLDLHPAGEFLVMAATLMRIKARLLLPQQRPGEEKEEDPRTELVQRLLEYKKFKEAARKLEQREDERSRRFTRPLDQSLLTEMKELGDEVTFEVALPQIMKALSEVLGRFSEVTTHDVELEPVALENKVESIRTRLLEHGRLSWTELFGSEKSRIDVIVTFMAMLELAKAGVLRVQQADNFSELWIFSRHDEPAPVETAAGDAWTDAAQPAVPTPEGAP